MKLRLKKVPPYFFFLKDTEKSKSPYRCALDVLNRKDGRIETLNSLAQWVDEEIRQKHSYPHFKSLKNCMIAVYSLATSRSEMDFDEQRLRILFAEKLEDSDDLQDTCDNIRETIRHASFTIAEETGQKSIARIFEDRGREVLEDVLLDLLRTLQTNREHTKLSELKNDAEESSKGSFFKEVTLNFFKTAKAV